MTDYVVGFLFDGLGNVLLLQKNRPDWQKGKLNGIGGHVEEGESYDAAMAREFAEEAGLNPVFEHFATLRGEHYSIGCYRAEDATALRYPKRFRNDVGEALVVASVAEVPHLTTVPNLRWLIPMAHPRCRHDWPYRVHEKGDDSGVWR